MQGDSWHEKKNIAPNKDRTADLWVIDQELFLQATDAIGN